MLYPYELIHLFLFMMGLIRGFFVSVVYKIKHVKNQPPHLNSPTRPITELDSTVRALDQLRMRQLSKEGMSLDETWAYFDAPYSGSQSRL